MYIQEILIEINSNADRDELYKEFFSLMADFYQNGQIQGHQHSQYFTENKIISLPYTLEEDSLDKKYFNKYIESDIKKIEEKFKSKIQFRTLGKTFDDYNRTCNCENFKFYILTTDFLTINSPIICGSCFKPVPLYKIPKYDNEGYYKILKWQDNYQSCSMLDINSTVGERWALKQLSDAGSQLSKEGIEISRRIEEITNVPVYYFLFNYKRHKGNELLWPCPGCNNKWDLKEPLYDFYAFKCDKCRLISSLSVQY